MSNETKPCPNCGKTILTVAKRCMHCGVWFEEHKTFLDKFLDMLLKILLSPIFFIVKLVSFIRGFFRIW